MWLLNRNLGRSFTQVLGFSLLPLISVQTCELIINENSSCPAIHRLAIKLPLQSQGFLAFPVDSSFTLTRLSLEADVRDTSESPSYRLKKAASKVGRWKGRENLIPLMVNKLFSEQEPRPKLLQGDPVPVKSGPYDRAVTCGWIWKVSLTQWEKDQKPVPGSLPLDYSKWMWTLWIVRYARLPLRGGLSKLVFH